MFVQSIDALYDTVFSEETVERTAAEKEQTLRELRALRHKVIPGALPVCTLTVHGLVFCSVSASAPASRVVCGYTHPCPPPSRPFFLFQTLLTISFRSSCPCASRTPSAFFNRGSSTSS